MPANRNWRRWIHASIGDQLSAIAAAEDPPIPSLVEGIQLRETAFMEASDRIEIRVNGPFTIQYDPENWTGRVFINVLVASAIGEIKAAYTFDDILGLFHRELGQPIECFRKGTGFDDDGTSIGCLIPLGEKATPVRVLDFGEIDPTDHLRQGMVTGVYEIELFEPSC